jgi:hypothetical protein
MKKFDHMQNTTMFQIGIWIIWQIQQIDVADAKPTIRCR